MSIREVPDQLLEDPDGALDSELVVCPDGLHQNVEQAGPRVGPVPVGDTFTNSVDSNATQILSCSSPPAREKATVFLTLDILSFSPMGSMFLMACLAAGDVSGGRNFSDSALQWTSMYCFSMTAASCRSASCSAVSRTRERDTVRQSS